jgi:hypothetical protein
MIFYSAIFARETRNSFAKASVSFGRNLIKPRSANEILGLGIPVNK